MESRIVFIFLVTVLASGNALRSRTSPGIQSFAQMIDHLHLKNRRLPLNSEDDQNLVGEVNSLDRMQPGSFATYEMQRPFRASQQHNDDDRGGGGGDTDNSIRRQFNIQGRNRGRILFPSPLDATAFRQQQPQPQFANQQRQLPNQNVFSQQQLQFQQQQQRQQQMQLLQQQQLQQQRLQQQQQQQQQRQNRLIQQNELTLVESNVFGQCEDRYSQLVEDIFMSNEVVPEIFDSPPKHLLDLRFKTVRTYPGMKMTADATRFTPNLKWPLQGGAMYTVILSNLDINNRKNRTLAEFWHWFVGNVPGNDIDSGEVILDLLHPLVLKDGEGDHRFGYFVLRQRSGRVDYSAEGGPTDSCSPNMSQGRGPFRSTPEFMKKYDLEFTAATFLIIEHNEASNQIACEWQDCMAGFVYLDGLRCEDKGFPQLKTTALRLRRQENRRRAERPTWRNTFW